MTEKVIITLTEKELIEVLSKHFDLQSEKTTINLKISKTPDEKIPPSEFLTITSDRESQTDVNKKNNSNFWDNR